MRRSLNSCCKAVSWSWIEGVDRVKGAELQIREAKIFGERPSSSLEVTLPIDNKVAIGHSVNLKSQ